MSSSLQPIPYQGSKRKIANQIMQYSPKKIERVIEPFAGSAAITIYAALNNYGQSYIVNDSYKPLIDLWNLIIDQPDYCVSEYEKIWNNQLDNPKGYYLRIREEFNDDKDPIKLLYLVTRCVKNAVRFNSEGKFNQSEDSRRLGRSPREMKKQIINTSLLLKRKIVLFNKDYSDILSIANENDLVYMDPPYQGTSNGKNPRYHQGIDMQKLIKNLELLIDNNVAFLLSFDGICGSRSYGMYLPEYLHLKRVDIYAGRSSQSTLNGRSEDTIESLYVSPNLLKADVIKNSVFSTPQIYKNLEMYPLF